MTLRRFIFVSVGVVFGALLVLVLGIELCLRFGIIKKRYGWQGRRVINSVSQRLPETPTNNLTIRSSELPPADAAGSRSP
jgi:hypothetical protein